MVNFCLKSWFAGHPKKTGFTLRYFTVFAREFMVFARVVHGVVENLDFYIFLYFTGYAWVMVGFLRCSYGFFTSVYGVQSPFARVPLPK